MSDINEYNKHTFLSRVLGNSASNSASTANPLTKNTSRNDTDKADVDRTRGYSDAPFLDDGNMELQFSNTYAYLDKNNEKIKNMLMSEVSLKNDVSKNMDSSSNNGNKTSTKTPNSKRRLRSNISINFNSESESSDENSDENSVNDNSEEALNSAPTYNLHKSDRSVNELVENAKMRDNSVPMSPFEAATNGLSESAKDKIREELELELELGNDDIPESLLFENINKGGEPSG